MNCERAMNAFQAALDEGRLDAAPAEAREHVERCPECRAAWAELSAMEGQLRAGALRGAVGPGEAAPPMLRSRVLSALEREPMPRRAGVWGPRLKTAAVAVAILVALAAVRRARQDGATDRSEHRSRAQRVANPAPAQSPTPTPSGGASEFSSSFPIASAIFETPKRALLAAKEDAKAMAWSMWSPADAAMRAFAPRDSADNQ